MRESTGTCPVSWCIPGTRVEHRAVRQPNSRGWKRNKGRGKSVRNLTCFTYLIPGLERLMYHHRLICTFYPALLSGLLCIGCFT